MKKRARTKKSQGSVGGVGIGNLRQGVEIVARSIDNEQDFGRITL